MSREANRRRSWGLVLMHGTAGHGGEAVLGGRGFAEDSHDALGLDGLAEDALERRIRRDPDVP